MNRTKKPLVVVTGPDKKWRFGWWATRFMLFLVGLQGRYVTAKKPEILAGVRGVIIGGGDDIDPEHYGLTGDVNARYDFARDKLEMAMLHRALASNTPILGICRGSQLINVVLGGSLYQDIKPLRVNTPNRNSLFPIKWVDVIAKTQLAQALQATSVKINSLHSQAVDTLAPSLIVSARDRDNFIQATEVTDGRFIVGVQWHPEYMPYSTPQRQLFKKFAQAVKENNEFLGQPPPD